MPDDEWMEIVGRRGWVVVTQDYKFHLDEYEKVAFMQHKIKCFYLPDATAKTWVTSCAFIRSHSKILNLCVEQSAPFIYNLKPNGRLVRVAL